MRAVNLLPKDDAQRGKRQQNIPALVSTALVVLVSGLLGVMYFSSKSAAEAKSYDLEIAEAELALLPTPAEIEEKNAPRTKLAGEHQARVTSLTTAMGYRVAWDRVLREISLVLPEDVWLRNLAAASPTPGAGTKPPETPAGMPPTLMTIEGYTYSHDAVARLITRLSVIPDLKNVWLVSSSRAELLARSVVTFVIKADVRPAGATS